MIQVVGGKFPRQKRLVAKKLTDDDRNAFAATDAEHIMIMKVMKNDDDDVHMGEEAD